VTLDRRHIQISHASLYWIEEWSEWNIVFDPLLHHPTLHYPFSVIPKAQRGLLQFFLADNFQWIDARQALRRRSPSRSANGFQRLAQSKPALAVTLRSGALGSSAIRSFPAA
jgi:hypothetical protein